jgi:hypothetical protein
MTANRRFLVRLHALGNLYSAHHVERWANGRSDIRPFTFFDFTARAEAMGWSAADWLVERERKLENSGNSP